MKTIQKSLFLVALLAVGSCTKEAPAPEDENELITTVRLKFTEGTTSQTFEWKDLDGDGGKAPTIQPITLKANKTYKLDIVFLDESKSPIGDLTSEIAKRSDEHLVVYTAAPSTLLTYTYSDKDINNLPIGLVGSVKTNAVGTGSLKVQLRHQPVVNNMKQKNGTITPGSDDVNISFGISIN
jgi:hypothetical protein